MGRRRKAREFAVQLLYLLDVRDGEDAAPLIDMFWSGASYQPEEKAFANQLVEGTREHLHEIDQLIGQHASNWKISRMPVVDRNILRLGVYELCHTPELPASVVINEAVELGKRFATPEAARFINGVLDRIKLICREGASDAG